MNTELLMWSRKHVPKFNELSEKYNTAYYTQSPLEKTDGHADLMFVGINPKGKAGTGYVCMTPEEYLAGNPDWEERFKDGECKWQFNNGARFFMGYDRQFKEDSIDNDAKVVWTNISPFVSSKGFTDLKPELKTAGIESTLELISILRPERIILLGGNTFSLLDQYADKSHKQFIEHVKVFDNQHLEIGRIYGISSVYVSHPSHQWAVKGSHYFIPVFIFLHGLIDAHEKRKTAYSLQEVRNLMRRELTVWKAQIDVND